MSTPDVGMSATAGAMALKAKGIGINKQGQRAGFMPKSFVLYQANIRSLHEKYVYRMCVLSAKFLDKTR